MGKPRKVSPLDTMVACITVRRACALAFAVSSACAAGCGVFGVIVAVVAVAGCAGLALSRPRTSRDFAQATSFVAALIVLATVAVIARQIRADGGSSDPFASVRELSVALVGLGCTLPWVWRSIREHRVWLGLAGALLVSSSTRPGHDVLLGASWILWLASAVVVQTHAVSHVAATGDDQTIVARSRRSMSGRGIAFVAFAMACAFGAWLVLPQQLSGSSLGQKLASKFSGSSSQTVSRADVGVDTIGTGRLSLLVRGQLPNTPLLSVPLHSPALWRGTIYQTYTGQRWLAKGVTSNSGDPSLDLLRGNNVRLPQPAQTLAGSRLETDSVKILQPSTNLVWAPGDPVRVRGAFNALVPIDGGVKRFGSQAAGFRYVVTSRVISTDPRRLVRASTAGAGSRRASAPSSASADDPGPQWLQLPAELPDTVRQLATSITADATTRWAKVQAVEVYLRTHETYSLDSPVPGPGQDAVADFLLRDHVGFCEQFASAAAVLLRSVGVPTRVVSGLAYGGATGSRRIMTAADAHAWIEVYYPGVGWSPSDPTAGVALAAAQPSVLTRIEHAVTSLPALVIGALIAFALAAWVALRRRRRERSTWAFVGASAVLSAFGSLILRLPRSQRRRPDETPREWASRSGLSGIDDAIDILDDELFGVDALDPAAAGRAIASFDAAGR